MLTVDINRADILYNKKKHFPPFRKCLLMLPPSAHLCPSQLLVSVVAAVVAAPAAFTEVGVISGRTQAQISDIKVAQCATVKLTACKVEQDPSSKM